MERGVVVGGLMICGSFLLAASLNRSAVEETPPAAKAPIDPALPAAPVDQPSSPPCARDVNSSEDESVAEDPPEQGDLPGNGRPACSQ